MKRLAATLLASALIFTITSCSQAVPSDTISETTENSSTELTTEINVVVEEPSKEEIHSSVASLIGNELLADEESRSYYNFTDKNTGYFFQFDIIGTQNHLAYLLKTQDGGKTWVAQSIQSAPSMGWKEHIACAKMLNESVGIVSGKYWADANFSKHTYVTVDGGKNWTTVALPKDAHYFYSEDSSDTVTYFEGEAYDLTQENGMYFLHVRAYTFDPNSDTGYDCLCFSSTDLVNWTFIESQD